MTEIWRNIDGYPNYQVSNMGRVKSLNYNRTGEEKILKSGKDGGGYLQVFLYKEGKRKMHKIHRLVASTFLDNPDNLPQINHIDEDKTNNKVENIEYCDSRYNNNFGTHNERMAKSKSIPILQFTKEMEFVRRWDSASQVKREIGLNQGSITSCCKRRKGYKTAYGYVWGYAEDYERIAFKVFDLEIYEKKKVA